MFHRITTIIFLLALLGLVMISSPVFASETNPLSPSDINLNYLLTDHLGSTRVIADKDGKELTRFDYYPYGEEIPLTQQPTANGQPPITATESHKFTGKERDKNTSLDYFGARYLTSNLGRWISVDPIQDGWSRYEYVRGNPLAFVDNNGKELQFQGTKKTAKKLLKLLRIALGPYRRSEFYLRSGDFENIFTVKVNIDEQKLRNLGFLENMLADVIYSKKITTAELVSEDEEVAELFMLGGGAYTMIGTSSSEVKIPAREFTTDRIGKYFADLPTVFIHELGHAAADIRGLQKESNQNFAILTEQISNRRRGYGPSRLTHLPPELQAIQITKKTANAIVKYLSSEKTRIELQQEGAEFETLKKLQQVINTIKTKRVLPLK